MNEISHDEPAIRDRIKDSFGYVIVSFLCMLSGYSLSSSGAWSWNLFLLMSCYIALIIPYLLSREFLLERKYPHLSGAYKKNILDVTVISFVFIGGVTYLLLNNYFQFFDNYAFSHGVDILLALVLGLGPFILLWIHSYVSLKNGHIDKAYSFSEKLLLPAIFTCMLPFAFGWSLTGSKIHLLVLCVFAIFVITLKTIISWFKMSVSSFTMIIIIFIFVSLFIVSTLNADVFKALLYGVLIALSLGVSEITKRVYLVRIKDSYTPKSEGYSFFYAGANWSSIIFPMLLALLPLFSDEIPLWPILIFISIQTVHWFLVDDLEVTKKIYRNSLIIGFMLPILIGSIPFLNLKPTIIPKENLYGWLAFIALLIGIAPLAIKLILGDERSVTRFFSLKFENEAFLERKNRYLCFIYVLVGLIFVSVPITLLIEWFSDSIIVKTKANELIIFSLIMMIIITVIYFRRRSDSILIKDDPTKITVDNNSTKQSSSSSPIVALGHLVNTIRPTTSLIPGLAVMVIMYFNGKSLFKLALLNGIGFVALTMFGFIVNDIFDYEKDKLAGRNRPISQGLLLKEIAAMYAVAFVIVPIAIAYSSRNLTALLIMLCTIVFLIMYSFISKSLPVAKGIITAILCLSPIVYSTYISNIAFPLSTYIALLLFIFGRETYMDAQDYYGDIRSDLKTLPYFLGVAVSKSIGWAFMFLGTLMFLILSSHGIGNYISFVALLSLIVAVLYSLKDENKAMEITKISLVMFSFAIPLSY